ncbi:hypothetical protein KJ786_01225 [Patescibacteria group bacterium]|nr:hypothetical protein [Patescibacteria group bacterium]
MLFGTIILVIGIALLLQAMGILTGSVWSFFWAILFIVIGLKMTMGRGRCICDWFSHGGMMHKHKGCCGGIKEEDTEIKE